LRGRAEWGDEEGPGLPIGTRQLCDPAMISSGGSLVQLPVREGTGGKVRGRGSAIAAVEAGKILAAWCARNGPGATFPILLGRSAAVAVRLVRSRRLGVGDASWGIKDEYRGIAAI